MNKIVFAGAGGHALSLLEAIPTPESVAGYTTPDRSEAMDLPWLGTDDAAEQLARSGHLFHIAFVYHGLPVMATRRRLIDRYSRALSPADVKDSGFATIIASSAIVTPNSKIGEGAAILNGAIVNRATIGPHAVVNSGAIVEHDCVIGSNTFIGPGVVMGGAVTIGDDCFIGLGSRIKNGVTIASGITVAMGAEVTRDLTEPGIYHGSPLRLHRLKNR